MSDPLSSNDGEKQSSEGDYGTEYDNLEDRIFNSQRPPSDEETRHSVRFEHWQFAQIEIITSEINTSKQEVFYHSYVHGLKEVREEILKDRIQKVAKLRNELFKLAMDDDVANGDKTHQIIDLQDDEIELNTKMEGGSLKVQPIPIAESVLSEVQNKYLDKSQLGGDFHRLVVTVGLSDSEYSGSRTQKYKAQMCESLEEALEKAQSNVEDAIAGYVAQMSFRWNKEGVDSDFVDNVVDIAEQMETDSDETVYYHLENITRDGE